MAILKNKTDADDTSADASATLPRTGPNVDNGLVDGFVTVDPETAAGKAAAAAREANGASEEELEDGVVKVTDTVFGELPRDEIAAVHAQNPTAPADPKGPEDKKASKK